MLENIGAVPPSSDPLEGLSVAPDGKACSPPSPGARGRWLLLGVRAGRRPSLLPGSYGVGRLPDGRPARSSPQQSGQALGRGSDCRTESCGDAAAAAKATPEPEGGPEVERARLVRVRRRSSSRRRRSSSTPGETLCRVTPAPRLKYSVRVARSWVRKQVRQENMSSRSRPPCATCQAPKVRRLKRTVSE